jgi:hypothetical protein
MLIRLILRGGLGLEGLERRRCPKPSRDLRSQWRQGTQTGHGAITLF